MKAHTAAIAGLVTALAVAVFAFGMPLQKAGIAAGYGAAFGLLPIGWIVLNIIFLHQLTEENGLFGVLQRSIAGITDDRRLQLLLIAFAFGAFFEGAAGFGTPVSVTGAILIGLSPLLMAAANSSGGVMGKMVDAQSIVVASTATGWQNGEGPILRYVFFHSIALAVLVGLLVTLQAYVYPFTALVH
jgi:L-lactate permease